ncbi:MULTISPECIES: cysteine--tRNA ligase [Dehalobacter]|jgi:cysteinyl-tRNA synthetase|uniref:Cysteine--tRNA ligase n=2 Tax=Dehalobacter restrictus TaxID=55583 RepID=A0A857DGE8_9FIRM|nr:MULTISPECIES: cysteine--tRNA ligase [Dehalobacter]AHF09078.1 cysteinyl-tRNA synthetase [Dehalobacter restrictus DSM 9455]MDJ0306816.1 cysteine--tRNA ligase [Dehalobacter sp.]OCZ53694.1 cysteine--tRNA ligase [Dehalobacter sp. TeCB1]QGZ99618.1 cysteine--tRNA ligase [Dehalobacter restrictus]
MAIRLYNTLTRRKEEFVPREPGKASMYACGPTTYNYFHLGNARMLVVFDMIRRYLIHKGFDVTYIQNFTDVDDKIIKRAAEEDCDPIALAGKYINEYFTDAKALNILPADIHPRATEHIPEMIDIIRRLEEKGLAYNIDGDVYFAVDKFPGYGKLSGRTLEDMQAGARVEVDDKKHNPMDFALWKKAKAGEPFWESPWGKGRPGWHIECSAMSLKYLGPGFDIHGGGGDLVFPHHENEIAQSEGCLEGQQFARYWMHNAFITINQEKMSKSLGNFFLVRDVTGKFPGDVIRFYLLGTHYRSPLDFDDEKLVMASKGLDRLKNSVRLAKEALGKALGKEGMTFGIIAANRDQKADNEMAEASLEARNAFEQAMDDDFNSAQAYAALFELAKGINTYLAKVSIKTESLAEAAQTLIELAGILGFDLEAEAEVLQGDSGKLAQVMELVMEIRANARKNKDWTTADLIRDRIKEIGIVIEDTPEGARWYLK